MYGMIHRIEGEICKSTRPLWEEVFDEDSPKFTEYYFEHKAKENIGYVLGQFPYKSMMFRTPYLLQIGEQRRMISYIVGVATKKEWRHRGYMRKLLGYAFREIYQEKEPFTFLMPANPAIYEPFGFRYVYERTQWQLKDPKEDIFRLEALQIKQIVEEELWQEQDKKGELKAAQIDEKWEVPKEGLYSVQNLCRQLPHYPVMEQLAAFANRYLRKQHHIYVCRDAAYYERQLKESLAQNGDIYVLFQEGEIAAYFLYAKEDDEIFLQEVIEEKEGILDFLQQIPGKKPIIMARIIHLQEMMKLICSEEKKSMIIEIEDELIPENEGIYSLEMTPKGSFVKQISSIQNEIPDRNKVESEKELCIPEISMHISQFTAWVLKGMFLNEIV